MATIAEKWVDKYRPKCFKEFIGNRDILIEIEGFILSGSIPHLFFHSEKSGTGKTALAEVVALKLLGEGNPSFIELNASDDREESDIKKRVLNSIRHIPLGSDRWVFLFDEAEGLKPTAQAILKRPMEKSKNAIFIFTTNEENKILDAIKSRCSCFEFKPLSDNDIIEGLKRIAVKENLNMSNNTLMEIAKKCKGDMRSAINELQKLASLNNRNVEIDRIVQQYMKAQPQGAQGVKA
jgi:DNA polymerase III delta prime subunit